MRDTVQHLTAHYNTDIYRIIDLYKQGYSLNELVEATDATYWSIRTILAVLNLRLKDKWREYDYNVLMSRLEHKSENTEILKNLSHDVSILQDELTKNSRTIQQLRDANLLLKRTIRTQSRDEYFDNLLLDELKSQFDSFEPSTVDFSKFKNSSNEGTTVLVLSDTHYNEVINDYSSNGKNLYNNEICRERIRKTIYDMISSPNATDTVHVYLLGDLINGVIHLGEVTGEDPTMKSIVEFAEFLGGTLRGLSRAYNNIKVKMVNGNHSRISDIGKVNQKGYDFEYILFNMLKLQLPDIQMEYSTNGYLVDNIHGHMVGLLHGDLTRGYDGSSGASAYRIQNIIEGLYGIRIKSLVSGHTHKSCSISNSFGGWNIVNGSTSGGGSDYGQASGFDNIYPSQCFFRISKDGVMREITHVNLVGVGMEVLNG